MQTKVGRNSVYYISYSTIFWVPHINSLFPHSVWKPLVIKNVGNPHYYCYFLFRMVLFLNSFPELSAFRCFSKKIHFRVFSWLFHILHFWKCIPHYAFYEIFRTPRVSAQEKSPQNVTFSTTLSRRDLVTLNFFNINNLIFSKQIKTYISLRVKFWSFVLNKMKVFASLK